MDDTKQMKAVQIDAVLDAFKLPHTTELVLQLNKLDFKTLKTLCRGVQAMQTKKITEY